MVPVLWSWGDGVTSFPRITSDALLINVNDVYN